MRFTNRKLVTVVKQQSNFGGRKKTLLKVRAASRCLKHIAVQLFDPVHDSSVHLTDPAF